MCEAIEELRQEAAKEAIRNVVKNMLTKNKSDYEIIDSVGLTEEELEVIKTEVLDIL